MRSNIFDPAEYLEDDEDIKGFLEEAVKTCESPKELIHAISTAARARGMTEVAKLSGVSRASLYKALGEYGNPEFGTIAKVTETLGFKITAVPK
jgi:probable addiction module antidote protein